MGLKQRAAPVMSAINVIPMADIMLVLLIIFMVITPMLGPGVKVEMAVVENPREMKNANEDDAVIVAVAHDGTLYLGAKRIAAGELRGRVQDLVVPRADKTVFVRSDRRAKFGAVVAAVDEVRAAGIDRIGLLTEKAAERSQPWE